MKTKIAKVAVLTLVTLILGGCCSQIYAVRVASRDALLRQTQDDIENDIGPKYKRYLEQDTTRDTDLRRNDWGLVVDLDHSIARAISGSIAPTMTSTMTLLPWKAR